MGYNVTQKLIENHLTCGDIRPGREIGLRIDQTLTQDATGTMVMLELEAMGLDRVKTELSAQYVDHNILQADFRNADDHRFLKSACEKFGVWYSPPGNGVSHPVHQECFGVPGKTLLGSDSHTPAAGAIGMLAIGAGGIDVALAMAGEPYYLRMPEVWGVKLVGELPAWVSAKDVILELLRRHDVDGGVGRIIEYFGPGLEQLSTMDRHVIANMGTELGATSTVFPSDEEVRRFLRQRQREDDWQQLTADRDAAYDVEEEIDLSQLEPLIAMPSSPGNVRPVREVAGEPIYQAYIGSSANPGYRDFAVAAQIVKDRALPPQVSLDINPTSRQILQALVRDSHLGALVGAGARIHQTGCNGCIGMGQAPATDKISLRTVPRNFPGRSGTREDKVCLVSPETAAASALRGVITDPRDLDMPYPSVGEPDAPVVDTRTLEAPPEGRSDAELEKGPNIYTLPEFEGLPEELSVQSLLKLGDDISTDEIMPAGVRILPYRSNIPELAGYCFETVDDTYPQRARELDAGHALIAGDNYGQGSSREHAALAPRHLGLRLVLAKSFARIHWHNLINFGILPLTFDNASDYDKIECGDTLLLRDLRQQLRRGEGRVQLQCNDQTLTLRHQLSERQLAILQCGGIINWIKEKGN